MVLNMIQKTGNVVYSGPSQPETCVLLPPMQRAGSCVFLADIECVLTTSCTASQLLENVDSSCQSQLIGYYSLFI